jgi:hypothetical protein
VSGLIRRLDRRYPVCRRAPRLEVDGSLGANRDPPVPSEFMELAWEPTGSRKASFPAFAQRNRVRRRTSRLIAQAQRKRCGKAATGEPEDCFQSPIKAPERRRSNAQGVCASHVPRPYPFPRPSK